MFEIEYNGKDVIISKATIEEKLGFRPGDTLRVLIHGKVQLVPMVRLPAEVEQMRAGLEAMSGSWSTQDVEQFQKLRQELWAAWQIPESV
ncbi:MAG: hypothetical protein R3C14_16645 [Caldilineaceae bacterium]